MKIKITRAKVITSLTAALLAATVLYILINPEFRFLYGYLSKEKVKNPVLKLSFLYVGQGDCAIIRDMRPGGKVFMIDCGPSPEVETFMSNPGAKETDFVETKILPYLKKEGITYIDYFIASHKDGDHIGGAVSLFSKIKVGVIVDNGDDLSAPFAEALYNIARINKETKVLIPELGQELPLAEDIICQIIAPLKKYDFTESDDNNNSLVIRIAAGEHTFLFTGDCEIESELDMLSYGSALRATVMKVPHHGSSSSSSNPFLDITRPEVAVFSCGRNNKYGFPVFEIVRRYEDRGSRILRTDISDNIEILTDGHSYEIKTKR